MIDLYSGTPGSGKSLHLAKYVYDKLKAGFFVLSNVEFDLTLLGKNWRKYANNYFLFENNKINPKGVIQMAQNYWKSINKPIKEDRILLIFDEAQILFNARDWQKTYKEGWLEFFTQHRKFGIHVIFVSQFDGMLDKQIRCLIENEYIHRKVANMGQGGMWFNLVAGGNLFIVIEYYYPLKMKMDSYFFKGKSKYYNFYNTFKVWSK